VTAIILTPDTNVGFAVNPLYPGFALPLSYIINSYIVFPDVSTTISRSFDVSDTVVYRYGYVSYDGQPWTPFTLTTSNTVSGDWIYTKGTATISFTPTQLRMNLNRNVSNNTYVVVYTCSRVNNVWDCHNGWQITKLDAKINPTNIPNPTCSDNIQNQGETGIDCGGPCTACQSYSGTIYYVSNSGIDTNSGTSPSNSWKTISKVNAQTFKAGDAILFNRRDTWHETLTVSTSGSAGSPITYGAYGTGEKPIIDGFTTITGWTSEGNGIYSKTISVESPPQMVIIDGIQYWMGRWPDTGWMTIDSVSGSTQITSSSLDTSHNWVGAELVIRKNRWIIDRDSITNQNGNTLTFASTSGYNPIVGWGYFIQNSLSTLTKYGEWYYDTNTNKFYMYFGSNNNPNNHVVEVSTLDNGIYLGGYSYITVDSISFRGANMNAIYGYNAPTHITIQNCDITYSGTEGIYMEYPAHCTVTNTNINFTNNNAIYFTERESSYNTISNNNIMNTGTIPGAGKSGDENYNAIKSIGSYGLIEYNNIIRTGYLGINYGGTNTIVRNNYIDTFCFLKDDCAGIYTYADNNPGKQVLNNIVLNAIGAPNGTDEILQSAANGLYVDGFSSHVLLFGNTVVNITGEGIHMNPGTDISIINNKFYQTPEFFGIQRWPDSGIISGLNISNNIFMSTKIDASVADAIEYNLDRDGQSVAFYNNDIIQEVIHLGYIDHNYYYMNKEGVVGIYANSPNPVNQQYTLSTWASTFGHDTNSYVSTVFNNANVLFNYNPTKINKVITLNGNYVDVNGASYSGSITLAPYTSVILIKN